MAKINFTKHGIEELPTPKGQKRASYHDSRTAGLGIQVQPNGSRSFFWFRKIRGQRRWRTLGEFPAMGVEAARNAAAAINTELSKFKADGFKGPSPVAARRGGITLATVLEDYVAKRLRKRSKRPLKSEKAARWMAGKYFAPLLARPLGSISRGDIRTLHAEIGEKHGQVTANHAIKLIRTLYNWAIVKAELWVGANPAAQVEYFAERTRSRYLQPEEAPKFFAELAGESNRDLRDFVILALFTAARRGDILSAQWRDISFDPPAWTIPNPKSSVPYVVPLLSEAVEVLRRRRSLTGDSQWVFPGTGRTGHLVEPKRGWGQLVKRCGLRNFTMHDLRRSMGSWMAIGGESLPTIGKVLGHQSGDATKIYARVDLNATRSAMERASRALLTAGTKKE